MAMKTYDFAYGRGRKTFTVEEDRVLKVVRTEEFPPMEDIRGGVLEAISHPIGCPSIEEIIKPGDTVAFICNDPTRVANSFDFMPVIVDEMNRLGVKDEDMKIVFALGTHRAMTHEEMVEGVGENVASRLKMYNSICTNDDDFEYFGTTSRGTPVHIHKELCNVDHVILTGTIVHHYFSGYGGGRKAILPGCAAMETVRVNHSFMLDENAALGRTTGNPCYEDQMEGVALFAKGRSAARIQEELFISKGTVSTHLRHIYQKMDVHSKQEMLDVIEGVIREQGLPLFYAFSIIAGGKEGTMSLRGRTALIVAGAGMNLSTYGIGVWATACCSRAVPSWDRPSPRCRTSICSSRPWACSAPLSPG